MVNNVKAVPRYCCVCKKHIKISEQYYCPNCSGKDFCRSCLMEHTHKETK